MDVPRAPPASRTASLAVGGQAAPLALDEEEDEGYVQTDGVTMTSGGDMTHVHGFASIAEGNADAEEGEEVEAVAPVRSSTRPPVTKSDSNRLPGKTLTPSSSQRDIEVDDTPLKKHHRQRVRSPNPSRDFGREERRMLDDSAAVL